MRKKKKNMKAIFCTKYGASEVLKLKEVAKPIPKDDEVCIKFILHSHCHNCQ